MSNVHTLITTFNDTCTYSVVGSPAPRYVHNSDCGDSGSSSGLSTTVIVAGVCSFEVNLVNICPSGSPLFAGVQCTSCKLSLGVSTHGH